MTQMEKIRLELPLVLPNVIGADDLCIDRLINALSGRSGIEKAHIKNADTGEPLLCLHYDPATISVSRIRELVKSVGAELTKKYGHYVARLTVPLHARSARLFSNRIRDISGVLEAEVSPSGAVRVEYDTDVLSQAELISKIVFIGGVIARDRKSVV